MLDSIPSMCKHVPEKGLSWLVQAVKAPGNLVISSYVTCPDITLTVTPDLKLPGRGLLVHVDLAQGRRRLGGSALAQAYHQVRLPHALAPSAAHPANGFDPFLRLAKRLRRLTSADRRD